MPFPCHIQPVAVQQQQQCEPARPSEVRTNVSSGHAVQLERQTIHLLLQCCACTSYILTTAVKPHIMCRVAHKRPVTCLRPQDDSSGLQICWWCWYIHRWRSAARLFDCRIRSIYLLLCCTSRYWGCFTSKCVKTEIRERAMCKLSVSSFDCLQGPPSAVESETVSAGVHKARMCNAHIKTPVLTVGTRVVCSLLPCVRFRYRWVSVRTAVEPAGARSKRTAPGRGRWCISKRSGKWRNI